MKEIRGKLTRGVLFHQDNAPAHRSTLAMAAIQNCGFQLVNDPPYSPVLAPSVHYLFPKMKKELGGHHFARDDYVMKERRKDMFYLTTHLTHFIYGYMASDIWLRTILIVRKETRCRHIGYSFRLTARILLYAPSQRQDSTYYSLCFTSRDYVMNAVDNIL